MRKLVALAILVLSIQLASAQETSIKGSVADTLEKTNLKNAVVTLLQKKDSTLYKFTRTANNGSFNFGSVTPGKYVLLITFPKFADFADEVDVKTGVNDFGKIPLTLKAKLLDAVVVRSSGSIRIKGDTTEFVADSFKVREGATVEDLLKKFPGFQVNSKGEITAQGKRVDKVLVDGEEFFGDDPTMATQNISSKAVDKVQLFDTKSDQQNLTGLGGESNTKTLNIRLKSEFKKGSFGRVEAATDFKQYHDGKLLYNRFRGTQKLSLYGTKSTTSSGNISWEDQNKLGIDNFDTQYDDVTGNFYSFYQGDEFSDWNLRGLPNAYILGGLYINKWDNERQTINGSIKYNYLGTDNQSSTFTKSILPDSVLITQKQTGGYGLLEQYAPNLKYEWKPDSLTTITLKSNNSYKKNSVKSTTNSETDLEDLTPLNKSNRANTNNGTKSKSDNILTYKRLFKKAGEQFTASLRYTYNGNDEDNFINSANYYYVRGVQSSQDSINQEKKIQTQSSTISSSVSWTYPFSKDWSLVSLGSYNHNNSGGHLNTFDKGINGEYKNFSPYYSNNFDYTASSVGATMVARYNTKKINFLAGTGVSNLKQEVHNIDSNLYTRYTFLKLLPQMQFRYTFRPQTAVYFSYRGASQQPTIEQLQPLRNNSDPFNITVGNPNLKIGFNHSFNISYNSFKTLSQRYFYTSFGYNIVMNAVTTSNVVDSIGRKVSTFINTNGNHNWNFWGGWNQNHGEGKWSYGTYGNGNGGTNITYVNGRKSINKYAQYNIYLNFNKSKENQYDFYIGPHFGQNFSSSSLQPNNKTHYITWGGNGNGTVTILKKFEINTDVDAQLRQKISVSDNNTNVFLWNARLTRKLFKKDVGRISFIAHDILDQNKGVNRIINSNFITDERYLQVSQYFQLKFEWSFNNSPASK